MSRRPLMHPVGRLAKAQNRMAPGGILWSESPIPRRHSPRVPMLGEDTALVEPADLVRVYGTDAHVGATPGVADVFLNLILSSGSGLLALPYPGDAVATVVVADGPITPPSGWTTLGSGLLGSTIRWLAAAADSAPAGLSQDFAVPAATGWAFHTWCFTNAPASGSHGLVWDIQVGPEFTAGSSTWPTPSDPAWKYSIPVLVGELNINYDPSYRTNSHGAVFVGTSQSGQTDGALSPGFKYTYMYGAAPAGIGVTTSAAGPWKIGGLDNTGKDWHPDHAFSMNLTSPTSHNRCLLLGLK